MATENSERPCPFFEDKENAIAHCKGIHDEKKMHKAKIIKEHKDLAIRALVNMIGDNTARARAAFRNCTAEQMNEQYGQSGKTRAQILAEYEEHDANVQSAIDWVREQGD